MTELLEHANEEQGHADTGEVEHRSLVRGDSSIPIPKGLASHADDMKNLLEPLSKDERFAEHS